MTGHIPITCISQVYSKALERVTMDSEDEDSTPDVDTEIPPELDELYQPGDYVRAVISQVYPKGTKADLGAKSGGDELYCGRLELSISPERLNEAIDKRDLTPGVVSCSSLSLFIMNCSKTTE